MTNAALEESNSLAKNLSNLLIENSITITELARQINAKQPVLYRIAHGMTKNPSILTLLPIVRYFGITLNQLLGEPEAIPNRELNANLKARSVPVLSVTHIASYPENCNWDHALAAIQVDIPVSDNSFAMVLTDSTMTPQFLPGYLLIFDPDQEVTNGNYSAVIYGDGHVGFKKVLIDGSRKYLKSINSDFPIQELRAEDRLIGALVQARFNPEGIGTKNLQAEVS